MDQRLVRTSSRVVRLLVPSLLLALVARARSPLARGTTVLGLLGFWTLTYSRYRRRGLAQTARERELLATATLEAFSRHYNERVPTIEEEFDIWGAYHQHRHEMRYDLVASAVRDVLPRAGGSVLDVGCGSALVADRILDCDATYVGLDFGGHHVEYAAKKLASTPARLRSAVLRGDGERLPFDDESFDVVVMSEVIEHLLQPERAVWEVARVLRRGGVFVMTTNNASEVPLYSPLSHPFAWLEKAIGATHPRVISLRPWVWPEPVDPDILPPGTPPIYVPHTHHIQGETSAMFRAAGLHTFRWSTFEFPPPQSATSRWLDQRGALGERLVGVIEAVATRTPVVRRLGCHVFMLARKVGPPVAPTPPPGVWPGPFSGAEPGEDAGLRAPR